MRKEVKLASCNIGGKTAKQSWKNASPSKLLGLAVHRNYEQTNLRHSEKKVYAGGGWIHHPSCLEKAR